MCVGELEANDCEKQNFISHVFHSYQGVQCDGCEMQIDKLGGNYKVDNSGITSCLKTKRLNEKWNKVSRTYDKKNMKKNRMHGCSECAFKFGLGSDLRRHMSVHTGQRFNCQNCDKTFSREDTVTKHMKKEHSKLKVVP